MPGSWPWGRRNLGIHRSESRTVRGIQDSQDELIGETYNRLYPGPESRVNGVLAGPADVDPDVPTLFPPRINYREPLAETWMPADGRNAEEAAYTNLEGEIRESKFVRQVQVPMQLAQMDTVHGWRQDTNMDDIPWPYRLIAGVDYSGPAHPQH